MNIMRVTLFTVFPYPFGGGIMSHITLLVKGLEEAGNDTRIVSLSSLWTLAIKLFADVPARIVQLASREAAVAVRNELLGMLLGIRTLVHCLAWKPDVINLQDVYAFRWIHPVARLFGARVVLTVHGYAAFEPASQKHILKDGLAHRYFLGLERRAYQKADSVITVDTRIAKHVTALAGVVRLKIIKNFLDCDRFGASLSSGVNEQLKAKLPAGAFVVLCPRRLVRKNGVEFAIRAMADERVQRIDGVLLVVGAGEEEPTLRTLVEELSLTDRVVFAGRVPHAEMHHIYPLASVAVVPSIHVDDVEEATSIAVLEALASGLPVVASAIGGIVELIDDGKNGLLVPDKNPAAIAEAIERVHGSRDLATSMCRAAVARVREHHDYRVAAQEFLAGYV
jgi:glycogen synthase